ncbi:MAG: immunoglobulin domain-containing protein, partial [Verrucomicrobiota bacterium]
RGAIGLITGDSTPNQALLAQIGGEEINTDLRSLGSPPLELSWTNRTTYTFTGGYGEISSSYFNDEMDATILEVGFHDVADDAMLMRDPKARAAIGKASMHTIIKFFNQVDATNPPPLAFLPEAPTNLRAIAGAGGQIALAWTAPVALGGSQNPTNYFIYRSTNGYGFGNPISVGNVTSFTITNLGADIDYYFRVTASNAGGESMPSEVVGCRAPSVSAAPRVLVVNGFDRFDRTLNLRHNVTGQSWDPPGNSGSIERVFPRWNNAFDYVVQHGKSIAALGRAFDSCQNEAIINNQVTLTNYSIVIWACGNETTGSETFSSAEQTKIIAFLAAGGNLFVSGADVANDLDRASGPTAADRAFLHNQLHASFSADNSASYDGTAAAGGIFAGRSSITVDNGTQGIYWVQTPDVLSPFGPGVFAAINYSGGTGGAAAIQYDGSAGGGRAVIFGFPFETITSAARRNEYMGDILNFFSLPPATNVAAQILTQPQSQFVVQGSNTTLSVIASGTSPLTYQWRFNGMDLAGATQSSLARNNVQPANSGNYQVVVSNGFGVATSQVALVQIMLPPLQAVFLDNFDLNTAGNWVTNRSSTDARVTFNYNYATNGIPSAPNSTNGTTRGVKFEANMTAGVAAAINISPVGQGFSGDYRLHFDLWINANGPFPAGGTGSTQHGTAGLGTTGTKVQWTGTSTTADGFWFAVDGEGQASDTSTTFLNDFGAFNGTTYYAAASGVYTAGTASDVRGNNNSFYVSTFPGGQTAPASQMQSGALAVGTIGFAWRDVIINKTGSTVDWSINGLKIATISGANSTSSNFFIGYWDYFISVSDNAKLSFGLYDNVRVERFVTNVPPYLTMQPQGQTSKTGSNVTFAVISGGTTNLVYQWRFNGGNIPGATGSNYTRANLTTNDTGNYSVMISNAFGNVTSSNALLTVTQPIPPQFANPTIVNGNQLKLVLAGEPGVSITIWKSDDLVAWQSVTNLANPIGTVEYVTPISSSTPQQFYRAQVGP